MRRICHLIKLVFFCLCYIFITLIGYYEKSFSSDVVLENSLRDHLQSLCAPEQAVHLHFLSEVFFIPSANPWVCVRVPSSGDMHHHRLEEKINFDVDKMGECFPVDFSEHFFKCSPIVEVHRWLTTLPSYHDFKNIDVFLTVASRWKEFQFFYRKKQELLRKKPDLKVFYGDIISFLVHPLAELAIEHPSETLEFIIDQQKLWGVPWHNGKCIYEYMRDVWRCCDDKKQRIFNENLYADISRQVFEQSYPFGLVYLSHIDIKSLSSLEVITLWQCVWKYYEDILKQKISRTVEPELLNNSWFEKVYMLPNETNLASLRIWLRRINQNQEINIGKYYQPTSLTHIEDYEDAIYYVATALCLPRIKNQKYQLKLKAIANYQDAIALLRQECVLDEKAIQALMEYIEEAYEIDQHVFASSEVCLINEFIDRYFRLLENVTDTVLRAPQQQRLEAMIEELITRHPQIVINADPLRLYKLSRVCLANMNLYQALMGISNYCPAWRYVQSLMQLFPNETADRRLVVKRTVLTSTGDVEREWVLPLSEATYNQIFDAQGCFKAINIDEIGKQIGRRQISKIVLNGDNSYGICIKEYPEMPGIEYAVSSLMNKLMGRGGNPSIFVRYEDNRNPSKPIVRPWLLTPFIEESLSKRLSENPHELEEIEHEEAILLAMITNPEDGSPSNYRIAYDVFSKQFYIIGIDNDHSLGPSASSSYIAERGYFRNIVQPVNVKTWLFCTDTMLKGVHVDLAQRMIAQDTYSFLVDWVNGLKEKSDHYQSLFTSEEQDQFMRGIPEGSQQIVLPKVVLTNTMLGRLYSKLEQLRHFIHSSQAIVPTDPQVPTRLNKTYLELLYSIDTPIGKRYASLFMTHPPYHASTEIDSQLQTLVRHYGVTLLPVSTAQMSTCSGIHKRTLERLAIVGKGEFSDGIRFGSKTTSLGFLNIILGKSDLTPEELRGNPSIYEPFMIKPLKEVLYQAMDVYYRQRFAQEFDQYDRLSGDGKSDLISRLEWDTMEPIRQDQWIQKMMLDEIRNEWHRLKIRGSSQLTTTFFSGLRFENLKELDISGCSELRSDVMELLSLSCPGLQSLTARSMGKELRNIWQVDKQWINIGHSNTPLQFPYLEKLDLSDNVLLKLIEIIAPGLRQLKVNECVALTGKVLAILFDTHLNLKEVWGKYYFNQKNSFEFKGKFNALRKLQCPLLNIDDEDMRYFSLILKKFKTPEILNLGFNNISYIGMNMFEPILSTFVTLRILSLSNNRLGDRGVLALAPALEKLPLLTDLQLFKNKIGYEGIKVLASVLEKLPLLTDLGLSGQSLGDESIKVLVAALEKLPVLRKINLRDTNIGDESIRALKPILEKNTKISLYDLEELNFISKEGKDIIDEIRAHRPHIFYFKEKESEENKSFSNAQFLSLHDSGIIENIHLSSFTSNKAFDRIVLISTHSQLLPFVWFLDQALHVGKPGMALHHSLSLNRCIDGFATTGASSLFTLGMCVPVHDNYFHSLQTLFRIYEQETLSSVEAEHLFSSSKKLSQASYPVVVGYQDEEAETGEGKLKQFSRWDARRSAYNQIETHDQPVIETLKSALSHKPGLHVTSALTSILDEYAYDDQNDEKSYHSLLVLDLGNAMRTSLIPSSLNGYDISIWVVSTVPETIQSKFDLAFKQNHVFSAEDLWYGIEGEEESSLTELVNILYQQGLKHNAYL